MEVKPDLLEGRVWEQILCFFFPVFFGTLFQQLYNTADAIIVGNVAGKQALAAVGGSTGTFIGLIVGFMTGLSAGATVVIAQYYGSGEKAMVKKGVDSGMFLAIVLGAAFTLIGITAAPVILRMLNVPEDMYEYSLVYLKLYCIGMIPSMVYNSGAGILRAVGDSKRPLYFLIISYIVNILLDLVFVVILKMGPAGAAVATVISQLISCTLTLIMLKRTDECYHFELFSMKPDGDTLKRIIKIGLPAGIQSCLYSIANLFIQASINSYGTDTSAAFTAFGKIDALFWNYSGALGTSVITFCGQNYGAGNIRRVKEAVKQAGIIYASGASMIAIISIAAGNPLLKLFTSDTSVIMIGTQMLQFMAPFWVTFTGVEILSSAVRACGDALIPMLMTVFGIGVLRITWIIFFPAVTIRQTLICYPISWILTSIMFIVYYLSGKWLKARH